MQTLTIKIDEGYLDQFLQFLQQIPGSKREIIQHKPAGTNKKDALSEILLHGPTYTSDRIAQWEQDMEEGYQSWKIEPF